ncbi:DUF1010 domain-containing protein, partial [Klebsiella pneumoniae]
SCAAPSAKGDDKFITTDYLQQCLSLWDALRMNMMISYQELVRTFLSFSGVIQCLFCLFSGLRLHGLRRFSVFLASSPCVASASSYRFCSAVPPRWRSVFSRLAPVAKFKLSVLASGSNISVKPTRILRSAYLAR